MQKVDACIGCFSNFRPDDFQSFLASIRSCLNRTSFHPGQTYYFNFSSNMIGLYDRPGVVPFGYISLPLSYDDIFELHDSSVLDLFAFKLFKRLPKIPSLSELIIRRYYR